MSCEIISEEENEKNIHSTNFGLKYTIFHLYLLQGLAFGFFCSIPLTYETVPNYQILSMFDAAALPFSFKFLFAPLLQRFTFRRYGKRKTWIVITIFASAFLHYCLSFVVGIEEYQKTAAVLLFLCTLTTALKDVGSDALAVEQIPNASTISLASFAGEQIGRLVTLSLFLAVISKSYWTQYDIKDGIMSPATFMQIIVIFLFLTGIAIHFLYKESDCQDSQTQSNTPSIWEILKHYQYFIRPKYKLCRQMLVILLMNHGILYFTSTFSIQLIKKGIQRQNLMFIENSCLIPNIVASLLISRYLTASNMYLCLQRLAFLQFIFAIFAYFSDFEDNSLVIMIFTLMYIISSVHYYLQTSIANQISKGPFSGITITVMLSISNFSRNTTLQKQLIHIFGYNNCIYFGFVYGGLVVLLLPWANQWIKRGIAVSERKIQ